MLTATQEVLWARRFGVAEDQVRLDHLLSHIILGIATAVPAHVVLFGGTALCRTHLVSAPWTRVSEDLDLLVVGDHADTAQLIEQALPRALRREYPDTTWTVLPTQARPPAPALIDGGGPKVRIQLLPASREWKAWAEVPTETRPVDLRYDDTPGTIPMTVPTLAGFAAMKLSAWEDRHAPRDLFDLAGLVTLGAFTGETAAIFRRLNGRSAGVHSLRQLPESTRSAWRDQLAHQTAAVPDLDACLAAVTSAVAAIT